MLRWSGEATGREIQLLAIVDPALDPGVPGGRELVALARSAARPAPDAAAALALARVIGPEAAVDAAAVAGAFELYNRVVDATGLSIGKGYRRQVQDLVDLLGLDAMPHGRL